MSDRRLLVCLHDVSPRHDQRVREIDSFLRDLGVGARYTMLVVPDFWADAPITPGTPFADWLRGREDAGVEMALHGYFHRDTVQHTSGWAAWKARTMTAREGEFLGLDQHEAGRRINDGLAVLAAVLARPVEGFVAPAWLYGPGAHTALAARSFRWAEDHMRVWRPTSGEVLVRGPVVSYASRDTQRIVGSHVWSRTASVVLKPTPVVRFALHPHDFDVPSLRREIERALRGFMNDRTPVLYRELG